jgi:predicted Rossmann fold nucleotide-binding protein DprA/Smf involved in DNA uptake
MLIRLGATPITSPQDLYEALGLDTLHSDTSSQQIRSTLTTIEKKIYDVLIEPMTHDALVEHTGLKEQQVQITISRLLLSNVIEMQGQKIYRKYP